MPNPRQPVELIQYKGRSHMTREEVARRRSSEPPPAPADAIRPPDYLNKKQKAEFGELSAALAEIGIFGNIDAGVLARYCVAHSMYAKYTKLLRTLPRKKARKLREEAEKAGAAGELAGQTDEELALELEKDLTALQNRYFVQCDQCARALGLCITARCRLVLPRPPEAPPSNKFSKFEKAGAG